MFDTHFAPEALRDLLRQLDEQHDKLSEALDRGAIAEARGLQADVMRVAGLIDALSPTAASQVDRHRTR